MMAFLAGMVVSLSLALSLGPGVALQFQASVQRGFFAGMSVVAARFISDIGLLALSYIGVLQVITSTRNQMIGAVAGGAACLGFGLVFLLKKSNYTFSPVDLPTYRSPKSFFSYFFASLVVNTMNPFVALYWMGLVALAGTNFGVRSAPFYLFFSGLMASAFVFDVLKCYLFSRIKVRFKPRYFRWLNRFTGVILLAAGLVLLGKMILSWR
jgi:threonine/homoserine/homoserine lactone efflux protein